MIIRVSGKAISHFIFKVYLLIEKFAKLLAVHLGMISMVNANVSKFAQNTISDRMYFCRLINLTSLSTPVIFYYKLCFIYSGYFND